MVFVILIMWQFVQDIYKNIINFNGKNLHSIFNKIFGWVFRILIVDFDYHMGDGVKVKILMEILIIHLIFSRMFFMKIQGKN